MSLSAAVIRELVTAGLSGEALVAACERIEASDAKPVERTARQERNRRYYEKTAAKRRLDASETPEKHLNASYLDACAAPSPVPDKEKSPTPPKETNPSPHPQNNPGSAGAKRSPRDELLAVLDAERAQAVIDHRQRLRKPLTAHAAKLLAGKFGAAPDPNAAADAMIANGWQGFEPEWVDERLNRRPQGRAPPATKWKPRNAGELALQQLGMIDEHGNSNHSGGGRFDRGDEGGPEESTGAPVVLAFAGRGVP